MKTSILLIYTGGTIGMVKDPDTGALQAFDFDNLLQQIPELRQLNCDIEAYSFESPIDSSNMNVAVWQQLAAVVHDNYEKYDGFVILHGSDTMSYTGSALSFMLQNLSKPVILTGSQLPIGDLRTDAKENLITSIETASLQRNGRAVVREVALYFEYKLYRANRTTKLNAEHFEAFASPNHPDLVTSGVHLKPNYPALYRCSSEEYAYYPEMDCKVNLIKIFPAMDADHFKAIIDLPSDVVILETYGSGNAPTESVFLDAVKNAIASGKYVINVTQCSGGTVSMGDYETSVALKQMGVISGGDLTTEAAIAKAMHVYTYNKEYTDFKKTYEESIAGELS